MVGLTPYLYDVKMLPEGSALFNAEIAEGAEILPFYLKVRLRTASIPCSHCEVYSASRMLAVRRGAAFKIRCEPWLMGVLNESRCRPFRTQDRGVPDPGG